MTATQPMQLSATQDHKLVNFQCTHHAAQLLSGATVRNFLKLQKWHRNKQDGLFFDITASSNPNTLKIFLHSEL